MQTNLFPFHLSLKEDRTTGHSKNSTVDCILAGEGCLKHVVRALKGTFPLNRLKEELRSSTSVKRPYLNSLFYIEILKIKLKSNY